MLISFLCQQDIDNLHVREIFDSYRNYIGVNSLKIKEFFRWFDRCFEALVKRTIIIYKNLFFLQKKFLLATNEFKRTDYDSKPTLLLAMSSISSIKTHYDAYKSQMSSISSIKTHYDAYKSQMKVMHDRFTDEIDAVARCKTSRLIRVKEVCRLKECANCGVDLTDSPKQCSRCRLPYYCSRACQGQHWKQGHKRFCVPKAKQKIEQQSRIAATTPTCAVCLECYTSEMKTLKCGHILHSDCASLVSLFCDAKVCPICRVNFD